MCVAPPAALSVRRARRVVNPAAGEDLDPSSEERRIAEQYEVVKPAGVVDKGSVGPCATANNIIKHPGRAYPVSWLLHSFSGAGAGGSGTTSVLY